MTAAEATVVVVVLVGRSSSLAFVEVLVTAMKLSHS